VTPHGQLSRLAKAGEPLQAIADTFGVSTQMARCRINRTGSSRMYRKRVAG
jgi:hypothetical protein